MAKVEITVEADKTTIVVEGKAKVKVTDAEVVETPAKRGEKE